MQSLPRSVNPFAMMLDPQAVLAQIERSDRLERLQRHICRPLDKPLLGAVAEEDAATDVSEESEIASDFGQIGEPVRGA